MPFPLCYAAGMVPSRHGDKALTIPEYRRTGYVKSYGNHICFAAVRQSDMVSGYAVTAEARSYAAALKNCRLRELRAPAGGIF